MPLSSMSSSEAGSKPLILSKLFDLEMQDNDNELAGTDDLSSTFGSSLLTADAIMSGSVCSTM